MKVQTKVSGSDSNLSLKLIRCRKSPEGREIALRFRHSSDDWKTVSVNPAVNGHLFSRLRQRKERGGLCLSAAVPMLSGS